MKINFIKIAFFLVGFFVCVQSGNAYTNPGQPKGFVNDYVGILTEEQTQILENKLVQFEKNSRKEIAVVIVNALEGDTVENFAEKLFKEWGIGKKNEDNGVLILVAKEDREMRIEVGYGLEGDLTDAQSYWIINEIMKPAFQNNDFYKGLDQATNKIIEATNGEEIPSLEVDQKQDNTLGGETILGFIFFGFMWLSAILGRSKSWWFGGMLGGILGVVIGVIKGFLYFGFISLSILIPLGLLFDYIVSKKYSEGKDRGSVPWWIGGDSWGNGKGGGFGGFGGGLSGGGGSSGRW